MSYLFVIVTFTFECLKSFVLQNYAIFTYLQRKTSYLFFAISAECSAKRKRAFRLGLHPSFYSLAGVKLSRGKICVPRGLLLYAVCATSSLCARNVGLLYQQFLGCGAGGCYEADEVGALRQVRGVVFAYIIKLNKVSMDKAIYSQSVVGKYPIDYVSPVAIVIIR